MGIMSNKVTRRVALGSIAGGLAGTAAVLHVLRGKYDVTLQPGNKSLEIEDARFRQFARDVGPINIRKLDNDGYLAEWNSYTKILDVPIREISGPSTFALEYRLEPNMAFRISRLSATYLADKGDGRYPAPPFFYTIVDGFASGMTLMVDGKATLMINAKRHVTFSRNHEQAMQCSGCVATIANDAVNYYEIRNGMAKEFDIAKRNLPAEELARALAFHYPRGALVKGMKWINRKTDADDADESCEIVGFAEIGEREAVKITSEKCMNAPVPHVTVLGNFGSGLSDREREERAKKFAREHQPKNVPGTYTVSSTRYLDLRTGLVMRWELESIIHYPEAPNQDQGTFEFSQVSPNQPS